jgi:hippurate hydrolase
VPLPDSCIALPKPTIETGVEAMTLAVLSVFDQHAREK